jgi:nitric oxide reductase NorQ protein
MLVISYNPGYQSVLKEIKPSTRQRFVALEFDYPGAEVETQIVAAEGGIDAATARKLVKLGKLSHYHARTRTTSTRFCRACPD